MQEKNVIKQKLEHGVWKKSIHARISKKTGMFDDARKKKVGIENIKTET